MKSTAPATLLLIACLCVTGLAQVERTITKTFSLDSDGRVSIETYKGSITVDVWDKEEVYLEAIVELRDSDDDARDAIDLVDIEIDASAGSFHVETSYDRLKRRRKGWGFWANWNNELPNVHYTLRIPARASLTVDDYKSSAKITGLSNDLTYETYKGEAVVKDHSGEIRLETYKGDIEVEFHGKVYASAFETYKGDIVVRLPHDAGFDVRLDLGRRADLISDFDIDDDRRSRDSVNGGGATLRFESTKGTIRVDSQ